MNSRITITHTLLGLPILWALSFPSMADLAAEIADLKQQSQRLQAELAALKNSNKTLQRTRDNRQAGVIAGPHFGIDATYDGAKLLINEPSLKKDLGLLRQKQFLNKAYGSVVDSGSRVTVSGTVGSDLVYHRKPIASGVNVDKSDLAVRGELDFAAQLNDWWTAYTKFDGESSNGNVAFKQGFITFGNLDQAPVYASVGEFYLPSGSFSSHMVSDSLPKALARTRAPAVSISYASSTVNAALFAYKGVTQRQGDTGIDHVGSSVEYLGRNFKAGLAYVNNLASSSGMETAFSNSTQRVLRDRVPAITVYASAQYEPFGFAAEYVSALRGFARSDMVLEQNRSAKPSASLLEMYRNMHIFSKESYIAFSYGRTADAVALELPKQQYGATWAINLYKNTALYVEYLRKRDYDKHDVASGEIVSRTGTGKTDQVLTLEMNVYF